ncbi:hypothetical protein BgAZ_208050 [Babesia gibsoni]|uniref:Uncharacterized protein n=1 Tax=Babesia gibsoni TaxID=33632 RepID=A0AAD8PEN6_BABGI|nr:hypothetical protein BgAZ_208050 [Babesia gibsoni]
MEGDDTSRTTASARRMQSRGCGDDGTTESARELVLDDKALEAMREEKKRDSEILFVRRVLRFRFIYPGIGYMVYWKYRNEPRDSVIYQISLRALKQCCLLAVLYIYVFCCFLTFLVQGQNDDFVGYSYHRTEIVNNARDVLEDNTAVGGG